MSYDQLCQKIGTAIFKIGSNVNSLQKQVSIIGTQGETPALRAQWERKKVEIQNAVESTNGMMRQVTDMCKESASPQEEKTRKIQVERLRQQFTDALKQYKKYQSIEAEKERAALTRMRSRTASLRSEMTRQPIVDTQYAENDQLVDDDNRQQKLAELQEFQDELDTTTALINEREEAIRRLESDMVTVNEMFREIGAMVHEQGDMIDNIEANVEVAKDRVEDGTAQVIKASEYQNKYRKKVFILLAIVVVAAVVIGLVIYLTTRGKK